MKADAVAVEGHVIEVHRGDLNRVELANGAAVLACRCGKMVKARVPVVTGDRVKVELSPYDVTRGRIVRRLG